MKELVKKIIPEKFHPFLQDAYILFKGMIYLFSLRGSKYSCPFCNHSFCKFIPDGLKFKILKEKKIIGAGYRKNSNCPFCLSSDRERLVYLFLKSKDLIKPRMKLLHIAPERNLQKKLKKIKIKYFSADLESPLAKIKMNITKIKFPKNYFDAIICNHVLEHIADDKKAMKELYRVLKPKGWAILQVPYSPIMKKSFEDSSITSTRDRERFFGQEDHVRIYGTDYKKRLQSAGFSVKQKKLDINSTKKFSLNPKETIFFCKK